MPGEPVEPTPGEYLRRSGMARLRNYFLTGLVIAAPLVLTVYITWSLIQWIDSWVKPFIPARYNPDVYLPFPVPGFGLVVALVFLTLLGFLAANFVGRTLVSYSDLMLGRMPLVRNLYSALKQIFETVLSSRAKSFQTVGLIEYPRRGIWTVVFVAGDTRGEIAERLGGAAAEKYVTVFVPPTPVPTAGFILFVKESELVYLDMSVEDAAKFVISAGLVTPEFQANATDLAETALAESRKRPVPLNLPG